MPHVRLDILCGDHKAKATKHSAGFANSSIKNCLADCLADLDKQLLIALADAPLGIDRFTLDFRLSDLTPRGVLAAFWVDAVQELHQIVSILPESTKTLARK